MGTTGMNRPKGFTHRQWFTEEYQVLDSERLVDIASVGTTVYAAYRDPFDEKVGAVVILTQWGRGYMNFYSKELTEKMGPWEAKCPERILDLLDETDDETALEWRARCRAYHEKRKATPKTKKGDLIRFAEPIEFQNGFTHDLFLLVDARRRIAKAVHEGAPGYGLYRLGNYREREFEVVA